MNIEKDSPHLAGALRRALGAECAARLAPAWRFALEHNALSEPDFVRPAAESRFNPRPARVALIMLHEARLADETALAACILSCAQAARREELAALFGPAGELAALAALPAQVLLADHAVNRTALAIASALWLDRARHFHRSHKAREPEFRGRFLDETALYLELARLSSEPIYKLLAAWRSRFDDRELLRFDIR